MKKILLLVLIVLTACTTEIAFPENEIDCEAQGGYWTTVEWGDQCFLPTTDAGISCTSSEDCQGYCIGEAEGDVVGTCSEETPFAGCAIVVENGEAHTMCT